MIDTKSVVVLQSHRGDDELLTMKEIRAKTGLSQKKFAEKYKIPVRTIEDWERGIRIPPTYVLAMLDYCVETDYTPLPTEEEKTI